MKIQTQQAIYAGLLALQAGLLAIVTSTDIHLPASVALAIGTVATGIGGVLTVIRPKPEDAQKTP